GKFMPECHAINIWSKFMEPGNIRTTNPNGLHFNDYIVIFFDAWFFRLFQPYILFSVKISCFHLRFLQSCTGYFSVESLRFLLCKTSFISAAPTIIGLKMA